MPSPGNHEGCKRLEQLETSPVVGFTERLEEATGKTVYSSGGHPTRSDEYGPDYVRFTDDTMASERDISSAWYGAKNATEAHQRQVDDLIEGCPGLQEAVVTIEADGQQVTILVCGKTVMESMTQLTSLPQAGSV